MEVVSRFEGYTDSMMVEDCKRMLKVLTQSKEIKVGRGRGATTMSIPKYRVEKRTIDKLKNSIEYYGVKKVSKRDNT